MATHRRRGRHRASGAARATSRTHTPVPLPSLGPVMALSVCASSVLAASFSGTLAEVVAQITNASNTAGSKNMLKMQEFDGTTATGSPACASDASGTTVAPFNNTLTGVNMASCTLNKYDNDSTYDLAPGGSNSKTVTIKNASGTATKLKVKMGSCVDGDLTTPGSGFTGSPCAKFSVATSLALTSGSSGTLTGIPATSPNALAGTTSLLVNNLSAGGSVNVTFTVTFPNTLSDAEKTSLMGRKVTQDIVWTFEDV